LLLGEAMMPSDAPPPLPEPSLPSAPPPPVPFAAHPVFQGRLHPLTLVFAAWSLVRGFIIPAIFILWFGPEKFLGGFLLVFVMIPLALAVVRYFTFTYRIEGGELITQHGILGRTERHIPLGRVQDIRIEQGVLHRIFDMADVHVETAGGQGAEASLSVLSRKEAERLRAAIFEQVPAPLQAAATGAATPIPPAREILRHLSLRDLILAGATSNHMASALVLVFFVWQFLDDILPKDTYERFLLWATQSAQQWLERVGQQGWVVFLTGSAVLVVVGMVISVVGSVVLFYGFTLSRRGEDLHRSYGLLTRRSSSLPRRRIQVLQVEESFLRRLLHLATLRADSAGSRPIHGEQGRGGRDVLLPILRRADVDALLPSFFPDLEADPGRWRRVSRRAIRRGTIKGSAALGLVAVLGVWLQRNWLGLWPLLFLPAVYGLNVMSYRHIGYLLSERYFRTRRGWLNRLTHLVPIRKAQIIVIQQTPFDRRHGVATLAVDTAGQTTTGGGPQIHNVPWHDAVALARELARRAAATRYKW